MGEYKKISRFLPLYVYTEEPFFATEALEHLRKARKEFLLALRSFLNKGIDFLEESGKKEKAKRVKVE